MKTASDPTVPLQAMIPRSLRSRVRKLAGSRESLPRDVIVEALEQYLPGAEKKADLNPKAADSSGQDQV